MYTRSTTCVRTPAGETELFSVDIGLHQGSALSPYIFTMILDDLTREIQGGVPWCMLFADDIVLVAETRSELNDRLEIWRSKLEENGLRINSDKTEYVWCNFSGQQDLEGVDVSIRDAVLQPRECFKYLGSIIHKEGEVEADVTHRIKAGWIKWRAATGVICDKKVPLKLKGKFYRVAIRPAMLYGAECWPSKKDLERKMEVAEMRMLRWSCGKTLLDRIQNETYRRLLQVAPITVKLREGRLRWFGHVYRRPTSAPVRRVEALSVQGARRRGRPRRKWVDSVKLDMKELALAEDMTQDRNLWRHLIRVTEVV